MVGGFYISEDAKHTEMKVIAQICPTSVCDSQHWLKVRVAV